MTAKESGCPRTAPLYQNLGLLLQVMMVNKSKLTNPKDQLQCYYHNRGYCKFGAECHYQHYSESCPKTLCMDKQCCFRHPKMCRNSITCKFFKRQICMYRHQPLNEDKPDNALTKKIKMLEEEVKVLEREIKDLKLDVKTKEEIIEKEVGTSRKCKDIIKLNEHELMKIKREYQTKESEFKTLSEENSNLRNINETFKEENRKLKSAMLDLQNKIKCKESSLEEVKPDYACDECEFHASTLKEFVIHIRSPHVPKQERCYKCEECKITFKKRFDLIIHHSVKHPGKNDITTGKYHHVV